MGDQKIDPRDGFPPDSVHLMRTAMQTQYQLSQMADQKANMLLAASFGTAARKRRQPTRLLPQ